MVKSPAGDSGKVFHLDEVIISFLAVVAFCFSMTIGVLWEFFEFAIDQLMLKDMQKDTVITQFASSYLSSAGVRGSVVVSDITDVAVNGASLGVPGYLDIGLFDTMEDLFVNLIGAMTFSLIGYFRSRSENAKRIADNFIPRISEQEELSEIRQ